VDAIVLPVRSRPGNRVHSCEAQRIHSLARCRSSANRRQRRRARNRCRWHRRCARVIAAWLLVQRGANGTVFWRARSPAPASSSPGFTRKKGRAHGSDKGLHRRLARGIHNRCLQVLNRRNGDSALSLQQRPRQKPRDPGRGGGPIGSPALWPVKVPIFLHAPTYRFFFDLIGRRDFLKSQGPSFGGAQPAVKSKFL